jgi:tRNA U34 2-thiouridine synthase MnmA/TrmU
MEQGIHVEGINFFTGFCVEGHTHAIRQKDKDKPKRNNSLWVAETLGIKLHIIDIIEEYKDVLINPKHGYGALPYLKINSHLNEQELTFGT